MLWVNHKGGPIFHGSWKVVGIVGEKGGEDELTPHEEHDEHTQTQHGYKPIAHFGGYQHNSILKGDRY